ncbi:MAG TPA: VOC family protein [Chitinophagales bacterium]|nr:VOC family protein [Chitinophagales bacterium]
MNRVVNFDFPTDNPEKSKAFFTDVFGWKFTEWYNEDYWLVETGDKIKRGINGSMIKRRHPDQKTSVMVQVENIDVTIKKIKEEGGRIVLEKKTIPKVGYIAYFKDPEENMLCIMQFNPEAK